jgi:hypothetical protein
MGLSSAIQGMVKEISNGRQTVKLYHSVNRGKAMYQLAYYAGGQRVQKNFADKSERNRVAKQILGDLSNDAEAIEAMATPELESLVAARRVLAPGYALHVAVEEHAQAIIWPASARMRVLFPQPEAPITPINPPASRSK